MTEFEAHDVTELADDNLEPNIIAAKDWDSLGKEMVVLEGRVNAADADTAKDTLAELRDCILVIQRRAAAMRERIDQTFVQAIQSHGPIEVGPFRYVVSVDRTTRCLNTKATMEVLLNAVDGDLFRFCDQLVAQPFKPASVRAILPREAYDRCFEVVVRKDIEGQPVEKLRKVDTRFGK